MIKSVVCFFTGHKFTKSLAKSYQLEVKECERCKTHLNMHHGMKQAFVSKKHSLLGEVQVMKYMFARLDANKGKEG